MSSLETLQPEAGDDRQREVEIQKLEEMYAGRAFTPEDVRAGAGGIELRRRAAMPTGHLMLSRSNVIINPN